MERMIAWSVPHVVTRSLTIQVSPSGHLYAAHSISEPVHRLDIEGVALLLCFSEPATPEAALAALKKEWEVERAEFEVTLAELLRVGLLLRVGQEEAVERQAAAEGFASLPIQLGMVADTARVLPYMRSLDKWAAGQHVVDLGAGSGLLALFAARAGARKVTAIEESSIASMASDMVRANGQAHVVTVVKSNSFDVSLDDPADLVVHEILGSDPLSENILPIIDDARRRLLRRGGRLIPWRIEVCAVGVELDPAASPQAVKLQIQELGRTYGLDLSPLGASIESAKYQPVRGARTIQHTLERVITDEAVLFDFDLYTSVAAVKPRTLFLRARREGILGGIWVYFRAHLDDTNVVMTGPGALTSSWSPDLRALSHGVQVHLDTLVAVRAAVKTRLGRQAVDVRLAGS